MFGEIRILFILLTTKCIISEGGENVHISMNGLINQPILLTLPMDPSRHLDQVFWIFQNNIIASYTNSQLKVIKNEFKGRLEIMDNGGALRIGQLRLEDSGLYTGTITFTDETTRIASYNLSVYEPAPAPTIKIAEKTKNGKGCNVTIFCSTSTSTSTLSYTWKYRHGDSDYQLYDNTGDTIQMSLQSESPDIEVMCIVKNPADQKNVSAHITCLDFRGRSSETGEKGRGYYAFLAFLLVPLIFLGWYCLEMKKKRRKELKITIPEEIHYADLIIATSNVPNQVTEEDRKSPGEPSEGIVYSTLKHDKD